MKKLLVLFLLLLLAACKSEDTLGPQDYLTESKFAALHGDWELVRIVNGFSQTDLQGSEIEQKDLIHIDLDKMSFKHQLGDKAPENSALKIGEQGGLDALILLDENMYHWFSFEIWKEKEYLVLYQKCPVGAVLADGSYYYYSKR